MRNIITSRTPEGVAQVERKIYIPASQIDHLTPDQNPTDMALAPRLVYEKLVEFPWYSGFTLPQKRRGVTSLHDKARDTLGLDKILEVSTRSFDAVGRKLSPFYQRRKVPGYGGPRGVALESLFAGVKVFARGGPYTELLDLPPTKALLNRKNTQKAQGKLRYLQLGEERFGRISGYDYLYISTAAPTLSEEEWAELATFQGFSEITLPFANSWTCQAGSAALMAELKHRDLLDEALQSYEAFVQTVNKLDPQRYAREEKPPTPETDLPASVPQDVVQAVPSENTSETDLFA